MPDGDRKTRIESLVQSAIGQLILTRVKDPRVGFVTVTQIQMTADLKMAKVFYTVLGNQGTREETALALDRAAGYLQHELAVDLKLRSTPKLKFIFDDTYDERIKIDGLLHRMHENENSNKTAD